MGASTLVELDKVKEYLEITDTSSDTLLGDIISGLSARAELYCRRTFCAKDFVDYYDGDGGRVLVLDEAPVNTIAGVHDDTVWAYGSDTEIVQASASTAGYRLDAEAGILKLVGTAFNHGTDNIKVSYNAGYAEIPHDIQDAIKQWVADTFRNREARALSRMSLGSFSVAFDSSKEEIPAEVRSVLDGYIRYGVVGS